MPWVNTIVTNDQGQVLLIRRTDNGNWSLPAGTIDLGESVSPSRHQRNRVAASRLAEYRTLVMFPIDPRYLLPNTERQVRFVYDYYVDKLLPELREHGYLVGPAQPVWLRSPEPG